MARATALPIISAESGLSRYLEEIRRFPMLEPQEEYMLAKSWREHGDRSGRRHFGSNPREEHAKFSAAPNLTVHLDPATVLLNDSVGGGQPKPGSLADIFRREEWFEDMRQMLRRDACTIVCDPQACPASNRTHARQIRF